METDHRMPLIRSTAEFGYLTRSRLSEDPNRMESPRLGVNLNMVNSPMKSHANTYSPIHRHLANDYKTTEDLIKELSQNVQEVFPKVINSPYSFTDVKIMATERHAIAVTNEGFCVYVDIANNTFEEVLLSKHSLSLVLLCKDDSVAFVKEKDYGKIYCLELPGMNLRKTLTISGEHTSGIGKMCLSPDEKYLYARLWKGEIVRWEISKLGNYEVMLADKIVSCMNISPDGLVVIGTLDKRIILYSLEFEKIMEKNMDFVVDAYINFSQSGHLIILGMEKTIRVIETSSLNVTLEIQVGCLANDCIMTKNDRYIVAALDTGQLAFFDTSIEGKELRIKIHDSSIKSIHITSDHQKIYTFGVDCRLSHVQFPKLTLFKTTYDANPSENQELLLKSHGAPSNDNSFTKSRKEEDNLFVPLCVVETPSLDYFIAAGESNKIFLFKTINKQKVGELIGHQDYVFSLALLNENILASGSADNSIITWDYKRMSMTNKLLGHVGPVTALVNIDLTRLASGSQDRTVKIWDWGNSLLLYTITDIPDPVVALNVPISNMLLVGMKRLMQCWNLQSFSLVFEKLCDEDIKCFKNIESGYSTSKKYFIGLGPDNANLCIENPFTCTDVDYWGPDEGKTYELLTYLREMMMGKIPNYDSRMDFWLISPYNINILHFYAYFNIPEYLAQSIVNGVSLINSVCDSNALTISLEMKHKECVEMILKSAWKRSAFNPFALSILSESNIIKLNEIDTYMLPKLYRLLLNKPYSCPKYCSASAKLPIVSLSVTHALIPKFLLGLDCLKSDETEIRFLQSNIPVSLNPGSRKSIEFLNSFMKSKQNEVFETEFIQTILMFKWNKIKWILFGEWLLFMGYFLAIVAGIVIELDMLSLYVVYGLGGTLTLFSFYYSILSKTFSCWAVVDLIRFSLLSAYFFLRFFNYPPEEYWVRGHLLVATLVVSFVQGFFYFRLNKKTRNIMNTAGEVVKESMSLIFLLGYLLTAAVILLYISKDQEEFNGAPLLNFITIPTGEEVTQVFNIFIDAVAPAVVFIVLLAICTHNYEHSGKKALIREYQDISKMVLRGEYLMPWKRNQNWAQYIHVCSHNSFIGIDKLKKVSKAVKIVKQEQDQHRFEIIEGFGEIKEKLENIQQVVMEIKNDKRHGRKSRT